MYLLQHRRGQNTTVFWQQHKFVLGALLGLLLSPHEQEAFHEASSKDASAPSNHQLFWNQSREWLNSQGYILYEGVNAVVVAPEHPSRMGTTAQMYPYGVFAPRGSAAPTAPHAVSDNLLI